MPQARIDLLEQEVAHLRAENKRLRMIMTVRQNLDARQIRELEQAVRELKQAVQNLLHVTVPLPPAKPFDNVELWSGSFVWDKMSQLKENARHDPSPNRS